jgi:hypothetical protein
MATPLLVFALLAVFRGGNIFVLPRSYRVSDRSYEEGVSAMNKLLFLLVNGIAYIHRNMGKRIG